MTLRELRDELRPISRVMERRAAFGILNATERSDMSERVHVSRDWHEMLKRDSSLRAQVNEIEERERDAGLFAHRAPAKEHDRGHGRGR